MDSEKRARAQWLIIPSEGFLLHPLQVLLSVCSEAIALSGYTEAVQSALQDMGKVVSVPYLMGPMG